MKYLAKIKYLGTSFHGFQVQPDKRTVQGELSHALAEAFGGEWRVTGCSRTDAGVHANEFVLKLECDTATVPSDKLSVAIARFLPNDLSLYYAEECSDEFHPRYDVRSKEYLYRIRNDKVYDPFDFERAWFVPRLIDDAAISKMKSAAKHFIGSHDFASFMSDGSEVEDTVRTVFSLDIEKIGSLIEIKISADGFLYNMVRIIVGTLIEVAFDRIAPSEISKIIYAKNRSLAGPTAPPFGLYLNKVIY